MKIIIAGTAYPLRGGIAHYNALLAAALEKHHTVETITFKRQYPWILFPGKTQEETSSSFHGSPAPELIDSVNPLNWFSVGRELRRRKADLLIFKYWLPFFGPCFGTIARQAKRGTKTKVLLICDNVLPHERRPLDIQFTRYAFRQADYFIVQSDAVEKDLLQLWPEASYRKTPHPVYNIFGQAMDGKGARDQLGIRARHVLLFFGYVRRYKGLDILLDAMALLPESLDVELLVVGEFYDNEEKYRTQMRRLGLERRVRIHSDYLPNEEVARYFSASDAVVLPYLSATQSGIAQIAFNFDTPVIASNIGGLGEVVRDGYTGMLVPPGNPAALARAIEAYFTGDYATSFRINVAKEKQKYSWDGMVQAIEDLAGGG